MDIESSYEIFDSAIKQALKNYWNIGCYDDLYQECYMKILDVLKNNTYEPVYNLYGYAYKIARNAISTYMYHEKKITTLATDEFPEIPVDEDFDLDIFIDEACIQLLDQYKTVLPSDFTSKDIKELLHKDPETLTLTVVKGELIWMISRNNRLKTPRIKR